MKSQELPPIMTRTELADKINAGKMNIELHGHFVEPNGTYIDVILDEFKQDFEHHYNGYLGKHDKEYDKTSGDISNERMQNFHGEIVNRLLSPGDRITDAYIRNKCSSCGRKFDIVLKDENTITIKPFVGYKDKEVIEQNIECEFPNGPPHTYGEIKIQSDLVLANFFRMLRDDSPEKLQYSAEYDLCSYAGRRGITKWKVENQNVAYGQMGNMSLSVWINKDKDHIILTDAYIELETIDQVLKDMGMSQVGDNISLSVWRWEATDVNTLEASENKDIETIEKEMKDDYQDIIVIPVKHGTWRFDHYFDTSPEPEDEDTLFIYAELKLVK